MDYYQVDEAGADHDNFKPVPYADYWNCNCNGQVRYKLQIYMQGDDNWEVNHRSIIATRY